MNQGPDRPWAGTGWDELVVHGPPRWRGLVVRPAVVLLVLVVLSPLAATAWWLVKAQAGREALRVQALAEYLDVLQAGACVDEVEGVGVLKPVRCDRPHDGEVTGVVDLPAGPYPGEDAIVELSDELCSQATQRWVAGGPGADMDLAIGFLYPVAAGWDGEGATTLCYVVDSGDQPLTRPLGSRPA